MVFKTLVSFAKRRKPMRNCLKTGFRDSLNIFVSGGYGGNGLPKYISRYIQKKYFVSLK